QCGTQDMGSGTYTALAQLTAETLGIPIDKVTVELGDTLLPEGPFSGGSQVTSSLAPAVEMATAALRAKLCALAVADANSPLSGQPPVARDLVWLLKDVPAFKVVKALPPQWSRA